jgi:hypothetical protein
MAPSPPEYRHKPDAPTRFLRQAGAFAAIALWLATGAAAVLACSQASGRFCVDYYRNADLTGPVVFTATETSIRHDWSQGSPAPAVPADRFSGRWQGQFEFDGQPMIFRVRADDGVRLKLDGRTVIDAWKDQASVEYTATVPLAAGRHFVALEYYEATRDAFLSLDWEPARSCDTPLGRFCVAYFDNDRLSGNPKAIAHESAIDHRWGVGDPADELPIDHFSGRWQGQFDFEPGTYVFTVAADDGARLWVDGRPLIDGWSPQGGATKTGTLALNGRHTIRVDYFESTDEALLQVGWERQTPAVAPGAGGKFPIGTNLADWRDYSTEQPFLDVFKTSRSWITQAPGAFDTGEESALDLDANGWVRSLPDGNDPNVRYRSVATLMLHGGDLKSSRQGGEYVVLYEGTGRIEYTMGAKKVEAKSRPGRDVVHVDARVDGGIQLNIVQTDPNHTGDYLRDIRVVVPGMVCDDDPYAFCPTAGDPDCARSACRTTEAALPRRLFHPYFLRTLKPYKALRFMSPLSTNVIDSRQPQVALWAERATPAKARWSDQAGIPAEAVAELANAMKADPWVNMPHRASDDYIRQLAKLLRAKLDPARTVYVEYANEIWNTAFSAGSWVEQQGLAAWPNSAESPYTKRINWYGQRTAEMCDLWKAAWIGEEQRVVCVLGAQAANTWTASAALNCELSAKKPCQSHGIAAVAIAPYFGYYVGGPNHEAEVAAWTSASDGGLAALFEELQAGGKLRGGPSGGALAQANDWNRYYGDLVRRRGLKLLAYEGGQHLVGVGNVINDKPVVDLLIAANRDPRMGNLYGRLLRDWAGAGGGLFMHFNSTGQYGRYGSWGALENMLQYGSPKSDALQEFMLGDGL